LGLAEIVNALQIEPKFGRRAEEMGEPKSGISGDGALPIQNGGNAIGGYVELAVGPLKANPPPIINTDAVLPVAIAG
jgi:hypothetical protein